MTLLFALSCLPEAGTGLPPSGTTTPPSDEPSIRLGESALEFEAAHPAAPLDMELTIHNDGDGTLAITSIEAEAPFSVELDALTVSAGASVTAIVTFSPETAYDYAGTLTVASNDAASPEVTTELTGLGLAPILELLPTQIEVGLVPVGCPFAVDFFVSNLGNEPLEVEDYAFASSSMELVDAPTLPWDVAVGESLQLEVLYTPTAPVFEEATLTLVSNDPLGDLTSSLFGEGYEDYTTESYDASDSDYELSDAPAVASIRILVGGVEVDEGWSYDRSTNSVAFDAGHEPESGTTILVQYHPLSACP